MGVELGLDLRAAVHPIGKVAIVLEERKNGVTLMVGKMGAVRTPALGGGRRWHLHGRHRPRRRHGIGHACRWSMT